MSEVFRERVAAPVASPEPRGEAQTPDTNFHASKAETSVDREFKEGLEAWETEGKKKFINEYFDTHNIGGEFVVKMPLSKIDKFIRAELEERRYEKTTTNYRSILAEIEEEIGSSRLEFFERIYKLNGYIRAFTRLRDAKKKVGAYKNVGLD